MVSVVMTIFNAEKYLAESLACISRQTYTNWELIAVENGSTDQSIEILNEIADPRVKKHFLPNNIGRTPALQFGLEHALGKYVAVLDADDLCSETRFDKQVKFLENNPKVIVVGTWFDEIDADSKVVEERRPPTDNTSIIDMMSFSNPILHSSSMYRRVDALRVGGYNEKYRYGADTNLWVSLMGLGEAAIISENLASYRVYPGNLTNQRNYAREVYRDGFLVYQRAARELPVSDSAKRRNRHTVTASQILLGRALIWDRDILRGCWHIVRGVLRDPVGIARSNRVRALLRLAGRKN